MERRIRRLTPRIAALEQTAVYARSAALRARLRTLTDEEIDALAEVAERVQAGETIPAALEALPDDDRARLARLGVTA